MNVNEPSDQTNDNRSSDTPKEYPYESPFEKDVIDGPVRPLSSSSNISQDNPAPLSEQDFIQNRNPIAPLPFWMWLFFITIGIALAWGTWGWYEKAIKQIEKTEPFLQVTNREFSVFLWKFPNYLRANVKNKTGYLPDFKPDRANFSEPDNYVAAPPDLLFLYHTWNRLLSPDIIARPISPDEFTEFLKDANEWMPSNWKQAPEAYQQLINLSQYLSLKDLQVLPDTTLPVIVRQAFLGWKNYFQEGDQINQAQFTIAEIQEFLKNHSGYQRQNWRNIATIDGQPVAGNAYLSSLQTTVLDSSQTLPSDQSSIFLNVALYNEHQAKLGK